MASWADMVDDSPWEELDRRLTGSSSTGSMQSDCSGPEIPESLFLPSGSLHLTRVDCRDCADNVLQKKNTASQRRSYACSEGSEGSRPRSEVVETQEVEHCLGRHRRQHSEVSLGTASTSCPSTPVSLSPDSAPIAAEGSWDGYAIAEAVGRLQCYNTGVEPVSWEEWYCSEQAAYLQPLPVVGCLHWPAGKEMGMLQNRPELMRYMAARAVQGANTSSSQQEAKKAAGRRHNNWVRAQKRRVAKAAGRELPPTAEESDD